jgi:hypothetical protein
MTSPRYAVGVVKIVRVRVRVRVVVTLIVTLTLTLTIFTTPTAYLGEVIDVVP